MSTEETPLPTPISTPNRTIYKLIVLLILAGGIAYSNSLTKGFYLDDALWIFNNDKIGDFAEYLNAMRSRPAIALLLHLNYRIHGLNVFGYHLVNMSIHIAAALCLFGVVRRTLLLPKWAGRFAGNAHWLAFAIALLWEVHPLQTQAVTYIIQRCESLMGLFFLLSLYSFIRASQATSKWGWYLLSWLSCIGGASCKEVMVTVLPVMLCYDYVFLGTMRELIRRRAWFYGVVGAIWVMPVISGLMFLSNAAPTASAGFSLPDMPPHVYMMTQAWILLHYLRLIFVPYPQSFSYRGWPLTTELSDFWPAGLAIGLLVLLTAWLLYRRHWVGFLGAWFFGILSITSIVPLLDVGFEHRLYLPLAAFCALVVFATCFVLGTFSKGTTTGFLGGTMLFCVASILAAMTMLRNEDYRSTEALWLTVNRLYPNDHESLNNIAAGLADEERLDEAKDYYEKALRVMPGMYLANFGFGHVLCRQDDPEKGRGKHAESQRMEFSCQFPRRPRILEVRQSKGCRKTSTPGDSTFL
jgi:protein O-mannosyl-transferase